MTNIKKIYLYALNSIFILLIISFYFIFEHVNAIDKAHNIFYSLTIFIQICFAFGISGLFSHSNLVRLGIF